MSELLFTAADIAQALGVTAARARQLLTPTMRTVPVRGKHTMAWAVAELPPFVFSRLSRLAKTEGCRDVEHFLLSTTGPWLPSIPLAEVDSLQVAGAEAKRDVLAPILERFGYQGKLSAIVAEVTRQRGTTWECSARTVERWVMTARRRDRMRGEWHRVELYLENELRREAASSEEKERGIDAADWDSLWLHACEELRARIESGEDLSTARRQVLVKVRDSEITNGKKARALWKAFDRKWKRFMEAGEVDDRRRCNGGKPAVVLNAEELAKAKKNYVVTGSKTTALRLLANSSLCREEVAEVILKKRTSKHTLTKSLRAQIEVPKAVIEYHKSPTRVRHNAFINPRTLTYLDALGTERRLMPGDLFERDDMSNNFLCWVPWPWGGDPCSDRYEVRIARGQNLLMIDVASLYFTSFNFLIRMRDSYRADDIWQWVHHTYQDIGMPRIGERWERGTWASRKLRGDEEAVIEAGHTDETQRLGGMSALGLRVIESQSPTTKIIENRFNFFQTVCSTIRGQIGRKRGEMERINKIWTACRNGHCDPRDYFLSFDEACAQIEAKLHYVNSEPVEGELYHGIPAQMWAEGIAEQPLKKIDPAKAWLFARDKRTITASKSHLHVRFTRPDGSRGGWWFFHEDLYRYEGIKVSAYFDEYHVDSGATLVVAEGRDAGKVLGQAELIAGCPQFALGVNEVSDRDGIDRKRAFMDAVRSEYRSIGLGGRTARASRVDDGNGRSAEVAFREAGNEPAAPVRENLIAKASKLQREKELSDDGFDSWVAAEKAETRKMEEEYLKENPGVRWESPYWNKEFPLSEK